MKRRFNFFLIQQSLIVRCFYSGLNLAISVRLSIQTKEEDETGLHPQTYRSCTRSYLSDAL
jgi:hypothetical protein